MRRRALAVGVGAVLLGACDDQIKYVPWFETMSQQPAVETFEEAPRRAPEGAVSLDDSPSYSLAQADTALSNPLRATSAAVARGRTLFGQFCTPCHGVSGRGDGPVIMSDQRPRGIPYTPALDLHTEVTKARSDGYIWGMITEGRGLMPSYRRIPPEARWHVVLYVRHLQQTGGEATGGEAAATGGGAAATGGEAGAGAEGDPLTAATGGGAATGGDG